MNKPSFEIENISQGVVLGIDEAGCGPWAGPVVAAAVMIDQSLFPLSFYEKINDSKKISKKHRQDLYLELTHHHCIYYSIGLSSVEEIDNLNIIQASHLAMKKALENYPQPFDSILIDGSRKPSWNYNNTQAIIKGDQKSFSIAAASIIAKVNRDNIMNELHQQYPYYFWDKNAGYGTPDHRKGIHTHGICPHHRKSFAPIRKLLTV